MAEGETRVSSWLKPIWILCPVAKPYLQFRFYDGRSFWFAPVLPLLAVSHLWNFGACNEFLSPSWLAETKLMPFKYYRIRDTWMKHQQQQLGVGGGIYCDSSSSRSTYEEGDVTINSIHFLCKWTILFFANMKGSNLNVSQTHNKARKRLIIGMVSFIIVELP